MTNKLKYILLGLGLFLGVACKSKKAIVEEKLTKCLSFAKVRDYSNVEDCGYLLELEDGSFLFPQSVKAEKDDFRFGADQNIRIDYSISNSTTSLCVEKGKTADITCLVLLPPRPADCFDSETPTIDWMVQLIDILRPNLIYKYLKTNEIEYLFDCPKEKVLYDCKGNLKWQYFKAEPSKNPEKTNRVGRVIYRAEQNMD